MLKKADRLYLDKDIQLILKSRNRFYIHDIQINIAKNSINRFRVLVVVPKKIFKRAVHRNYIRRRVIALFEKAKAEEKLILGWDCMILIKNKNILESNIWDQYFGITTFINAKINHRINL